MKKAILHPLLVEKINDYSHLITTENQTKEQFLNALMKLFIYPACRLETTSVINYRSVNNELEAFYSAVKDSLFDTVKINENTVLFNYSD